MNHGATNRPTHQRMQKKKKNGRSFDIRPEIVTDKNNYWPIKGED